MTPEAVLPMNYTDAEVLHEIEQMRKSDFFGEIVVKVQAGHLTDIAIIQKKKPRRNRG